MCSMLLDTIKLEGKWFRAVTYAGLPMVASRASSLCIDLLKTNVVHHVTWNLSVKENCCLQVHNILQNPYFIFAINLKVSLPKFLSHRHVYGLRFMYIAISLHKVVM